MKKCHILEGEQEGRQHGGFPGESKFAANKVEQDNAYRSEYYREETPLESIISEHVNRLLSGMTGYGSATRAACDCDLIVVQYPCFDIHLFRIDSYCRADTEYRGITHIYYGIISTVAANMLVESLLRYLFRGQ